MPHTPPIPHTIASIAQLLSAELRGKSDLTVSRLDTIESAGPDALTFIRSSAYADKWLASKAPAALITRDIAPPPFDPATRAIIIVPNADLALITLLEHFAPRPDPVKPGVHSSAVVDPAANVSKAAFIGPGCVVGPRATIGDGCVLRANVTIEADATVGRGTVLHPGVVIGERCVVGQGYILYGGVIIGADGFGYRPAPDGRGVVKIPHIGNVVIGDAVEIGANSCVDRAKFGSTMIGSGTKIDNLVQIGHNCIIGRACLICGMSGIAGSVQIGNGVMMGGHCAVLDNIVIGDRVQIAGNSGVMNNIPAGEIWWGFPATPSRDAARAYAVHRDLPNLARRLKALELQANTQPDLPAR